MPRRGAHRRMRGGGFFSPPLLHADGDTLLALHTGESARIAEVVGNPTLEARLGNMGLRVGKRVTKAGTMPVGGPVTVECDGFRIALGRGIAGLVRVERPSGATETDGS